MADVSFLAKYPFTSQAKEYVAKEMPGLGEELVESGRKRVEAALIGEIPKTETGVESALRANVFAYAVARMIVAGTGNGQLAGRYALAEAKRAGAQMRGDSPENVARVAEEFGLKFGEAMPVFEYLKYAPRAPEYKLANMELRGGLVYLGGGGTGRSKFIRVLEEAVRRRVLERMPYGAKFPKEVKKAADAILEKMPRPKAVEVRPGEYPPCIAELLARLRSGENLSHNARWVLVAYLFQAGMEEKDVAALFSSSPDYDEGTTRYQVSYIKKKGYRVPSCSTLRSQGICGHECGARSPISYKRSVSKG
ncbi:MAG: hypothetical protein NT157_04155 [Candidatus Micrarchaeota archaeon]|nr:hypothetical protein [Candidatus Micrarchaeota archaeon]